ncbi:MAG: helix-turn-helix transcriptional regulator [Isosphaeraceae bacterium]
MIETVVMEELSDEALKKPNDLIGMGRLKTQGQIEAMTGLRQSWVSEVLSGKRRPYADQLWLVTNALGTSLDWVLDETRVTPPSPELSEDERRLIWYIRRLGIKPDQVADLIPLPSVQGEGRGLGAGDRGIDAVVKEPDQVVGKRKDAGAKRKRP